MDTYTRRARLYPVLLAAVPAAVLLAAGAVTPEPIVRALGTLAGACGIVAAGLVRDQGNRIQERLWASWDGSPAMKRLRWRNAVDRRVTTRLHERVEAVLGRRLPTAREEEQDSGDADRRYEEAMADLRELTRDPVRFRLVFEENVDYGFRRNCLGLRNLALTACVVSLAFSVGLLVAGGGSLSSRGIQWGICGAIAIVAGALWYFAVNADWVRKAAERYADRLYYALVSLERET